MYLGPIILGQRAVHVIRVLLEMGGILRRTRWSNGFFVRSDSDCSSATVTPSSVLIPWSFKTTRSIFMTPPGVTMYLGTTGNWAVAETWKRGEGNDASSALCSGVMVEQPLQGKRQNSYLEMIFLLTNECHVLTGRLEPLVDIRSKLKGRKFRH